MALTGAKLLRLPRITSFILIFFWLFITTINPITGHSQQINHSGFLRADNQHINLVDNRNRRANIPYFNEEVDWSKSTILWYGINEQGLPGRNYVDVRMAYSSQALEISVTVIDYYLWYSTDPLSGEDLRDFDAAVIFLDTAHDRSDQPQSDDYFLLSAARHFPNENAPKYHLDARGNGSNWDYSWTGSWSDFSAMQWSDAGPNDNSGNIDYGWYTYYTIPWSVLNLSGPPQKGTVWGLGLLLHDRDENIPAGIVDSQFWPESFQQNNPNTWGEIHFGFSESKSSTTSNIGETIVRASSTTDNIVEDAWMGGGGWCSSGHEGGTEENHGDDQALYTGSEAAPTHFPCFNKSFIRFQINAIPPGVEIITATLTLHHWGNADHSIAPAHSQVHLYTISDSWDELTIHWNNAPLAQENISLSAVKTLKEFPGWPGIPYTWNATKAVSEAYKNGLPVNLALYSSDIGRDTSKYYVSSETGDWNAFARPTLKIIWGLTEPILSKDASKFVASRDDTITFQISFSGNNQAMTLVDQLPIGLGEPTNLTFTTGTATYNQVNHEIQWLATPAQDEVVNINYQAKVQTDGPLILSNTASLYDPSGLLDFDNVNIYIDPLQVFLPFISH